MRKEHAGGHPLVTVIVALLLALLAHACDSLEKEKCGASSCGDGYKCCGGEICVDESGQCPASSSSSGGSKSSSSTSSSSGSSGCDYSGCLKACSEAGGTDCGETCKCK